MRTHCWVLRIVHSLRILGFNTTSDSFLTVGMIWTESRFMMLPVQWRYSYEDRDFGIWVWTQTCEAWGKGNEERMLCAYISSGVNTMRTFALLNCTSVHPASKLQLGVSSRVEECSRMIWTVDSINSPPPRYRARCVPGFCCIRWRSLIKKMVGELGRKLNWLLRVPWLREGKV